MNNFADRLRMLADDRVIHPENLRHVIREAAEEIERLQEELEDTEAACAIYNGLYRIAKKENAL